MTQQETINEAKYEADNARLELLEIACKLRAAGAEENARLVETISAGIEAWQNSEN